MHVPLTIAILPEGVPVLEWNGKKRISSELDRFQKELEAVFASDPEIALFRLGAMPLPSGASDSVSWLWQISRRHLEALARMPDIESSRHLTIPPLQSEWVTEWHETCPMMVGCEQIDTRVIKGLWQRMTRGFASEIRTHEGPVSEFFSRRAPHLHMAGRVCFHLVENRNGELPFAFMASFTAPGSSGDNAPHYPLRHALETLDEEGLLQLLSTVQRAAGESPLLKALLDGGQLFHPMAWTPEEAHAFLSEIPCFESCGILCRIPDWWKRKGQRVSVSLSLGDAPPTFVGTESLLRFRPGIAMGDLELTVEEARTLLAQTATLAKFKNRWVAVDRKRLESALAACKKAEALSEAGLSFADAMRLQLQPDHAVKNMVSEEHVTVSHGKWLETVFARMRDLRNLKPVTPLPGFRATLRNYQRTGLDWLGLLGSLGFGACLADDMGLGKTIQLLAYLQSTAHPEAHGPSLLVVPASLLSNWRHEIDRFAPGLAATLLHPDFITPQAGETKAAARKRLAQTGPETLGDLAITTYGLLSKYQWLHEQNWNRLILDEAQAIRNPSTRQSRIVRTLSARHRIALTGTPVENRLGDLWSLFDFLNPGFLGTQKEFKTFARSLKDQPDGYRRLRKVVSPFILR